MSRNVLIRERIRNMAINNGKTVKLDTSDGEVLIENIEEYVCGFSYFYVRHQGSGHTESFSRDNIVSASRRLPTGEFRVIHMKKAKVYDNTGFYEDD